MRVHMCMYVYVCECIEVSMSLYVCVVQYTQTVFFFGAENATRNHTSTMAIQAPLSDGKSVFYGDLCAVFVALIVTCSWTESLRPLLV